MSSSGVFTAFDVKVPVNPICCWKFSMTSGTVL